MILNLTEVPYKGDDVATPEPEDIQVLHEALSDVSRIDEAILILSNYEASTIIVDVSDECFVLLREGLDNSEILQGACYE